MKTIQKYPWLLLIAGIVILSLTHLTINVEIFAWFSSIPFLLYLHFTTGVKSRIFFLLSLILGWSICVLKIATDPIPLLMVPMFSIPIALIHSVGYLAWAINRKSKYAYLLFPAVMTVMEWVQYSFTPLGSWGAAAYTQVDNLILLQLTSLLGLAGLSFLIYLVNSIIVEMIVREKLLPGKLAVVSLLMIFALIYGSLRIDIYNSKSKDMVNVAAVGTDSKIGGLPVPEKEERLKNQEILFKRSGKAVKNNVSLIVWNEASTLILPSEEKNWEKRLSSLAKELNMNLVAGYIVLVSESPLRYENKYLLINQEGKKLYSYNKHEPVPGEPALKGKEEIKTFNISNSNLGGAICYDYDFPYLAKKFGDRDADIVAVPSSDWRGIDPIHTKMAALRSIEQGHSILRSTREGLSAAIDPVGQIIAQMSSFDNNDLIMISPLPEKRLLTLYNFIGDLFIYICAGFILFFLLRRLKIFNTNA